MNKPQKQPILIGVLILGGVLGVCGILVYDVLKSRSSVISDDHSIAADEYSINIQKALEEPTREERAVETMRDLEKSWVYRSKCRYEIYRHL